MNLKENVNYSNSALFTNFQQATGHFNTFVVIGKMKKKRRKKLHTIYIIPWKNDRKFFPSSHVLTKITFQLIRPIPVAMINGLVQPDWERHLHCPNIHSTLQIKILIRLNVHQHFSMVVVLLTFFRLKCYIILAAKC